MSPVMNARVEKFAHNNTCGLPVCHTGSREWRVTKIWGPRCKRDQLIFALTARKITGFDCIDMQH